MKVETYTHNKEQDVKSLFSISACTDRALDFSADDGNFSPKFCMYFKKNWLSMP